MGSAQRVIIVDVSATILSGCGGDVRSILVGAGINGDLDLRSNRGPCVDLVTDGSYLRGGIQGWGTSIATPRVSAVLSNLWGSMPGPNGAELRELPLTSATFPHPESGARWMARPQDSGWESGTAGS